MQNDEGVENVLDNKSYSFCMFCTKNLFVSKVTSVEFDVVDLKVPRQTLVYKKLIN